MARVVIADGREHISQMLAAWLTRHGHEVATAATAAAALIALRQRSAEVLITHADLERTGEVGLVPEALRTCERLRRVFVIGRSTEARGGDAGEEDPRVSLLTEPFSPTGLLLEITAVERGEGSPQTPAFVYQATMLAATKHALASRLKTGGEA